MIERAKPIRTSMTSLKTDRPAEYRARAKQARDQAEATINDEAARAKLIRDAEQWERMAAFEENKTDS